MDDEQTKCIIFRLNECNQLLNREGNNASLKCMLLKIIMQ